MKRVLLGLAIGLVLGAGGVLLLPGRQPIALPRPDLTGVIRGAATRAIAAYVADSARQTAVTDSLKRVIRRLRTEATTLAQRQLAADTAAARGEQAIAQVLPTLPPPARDPIATGVAAILAAGTACRATLANCAERVTAESSRAEAAAAGASQARRRAVIVAGVSVAVVLAVLLGR